MNEKAIDIANQRLANGEIDLAEHRRITTLQRQVAAAAVATNEYTPHRVAPAMQAHRPAAVRVSTDVESNRSGDPTLKIVFGVCAVIASLIFIGSFASSADGLSVGQLSLKNDRVTMKLANTSANSGDVLLFVEYDGINKCEHLVELHAKSNISNLSFPCSVQSSTGKYKLRYLWANSNPEKAAIANRISVDWSKTEAL